MYDIESIYQAKSVQDAVQALQADQDAVVISGGSDVLIKIREGKLAGCRLVSVHALPELTGVRMEEDGTVVIGAATSFSAITNHPLIQRYLPMLGEAVDQVGGPQIRNIGTIGGNVCNGVTSADSASTLLTLNAELCLVGPKGERRVPLTEFYTGPGKTVREHDEILVSLRVAKAEYEGFGGQYLKYGKREAMEIATLGCAVRVKLTEDKRAVQTLRVAYGVAAPTPVRCYETEKACQGMSISPALYETLVDGVQQEVTPRTSWRASKEFRMQLVRELGRRALAQAIVHAGGEA